MTHITSMTKAEIIREIVITGFVGTLLALQIMQVMGN